MLHKRASIGSRASTCVAAYHVHASMRRYACSFWTFMQLRAARRYVRMRACLQSICVHILHRPHLYFCETECLPVCGCVRVCTHTCLRWAATSACCSAIKSFCKWQRLCGRDMNVQKVDSDWPSCALTGRLWDGLTLTLLILLVFCV